MAKSEVYIENGMVRLGVQKQPPKSVTAAGDPPPANREDISAPLPDTAPAKTPPNSPTVRRAAQRKLSERTDTASFFKNKASFNRKKLPQIRQEFSFYTLWVRFSKYFLPAISLILVVLVGIWPSLNDQVKSFNLDAVQIQNGREGNLAMINARYRGVDEDRRQFSIRADSTSQNGQLDSVYELESPEADITMTDGTWLALSSSYGFYDRNSEQLDLLDQVNLYHDAGHEFKTNTARIYLKDNSAIGSSPITGQSPLGTLSAQGFKILEQGDVILFTGKSRLTLYATPGK